MNRFFKGLQTKDILTENDMPTHSSSGNPVVDLFYKMGGYRNGGESISELARIFVGAYGQNPNLAVRCLFYLRNPRGGMGERFSGRYLLHILAKSHPEVLNKFVEKIPELGRWDDLFALYGTKCEDSAMRLQMQALREKIVLAKKWMPREKKSLSIYAEYFKKKFGLSWQEYRDLVSFKEGEVVENLMCSGEWRNIHFPHVPSVAMKKYRKAFARHEEERYNKYLESVERGEEKINTAVLSPVDIVHEYLNQSPYSIDKPLEVLWNNLPDVVPADLSFITVNDVSGSMNGIPLEVSISLGMYLSQRNKSVFKNGFITFSKQPTLQILTGETLRENIDQLSKAHWELNTDLEAVFRLILATAVREKLSVEEMPTHILIISDMQFDRVRNSDDSAIDMIRRTYNEAGYTAPNIIFWNVRTSSGIPAKVDERGVGLVSGYSPNLLGSVLKADLNPISQVMAILYEKTYDFVDEVLDRR